MSNNQPVRIYFLGSGKLGIPVLDALLNDHRIDLRGIGSQPDRPVGRKQTITPTAFASYALTRGLTVDRIPAVNHEDFLQNLRDRQIEILLVVAFGQLLKAPLLALPSCCCLNVHASLLPLYRGACPINTAILNGDAETGVAFMAMEQGLDTGPIYRTVKLPILPEDNTETLESRLSMLAGENIGDLCWQVAREGLQAVPQPECKLANVKKISKSDGCVNWQFSADLLSRMTRAFIPWPHVRILVPAQNGQLKQLQLLRAEAVEGAPSAQPGQILDSRQNLVVACGTGALKISQVVPEGKKAMEAAAFLRGNPLPTGIILPNFPQGEKF